MVTGARVPPGEAKSTRWSFADRPSANIYLGFGRLHAASKVSKRPFELPKPMEVTLPPTAEEPRRWV